MRIVKSFFMGLVLTILMGSVSVFGYYYYYYPVPNYYYVDELSDLIDEPVYIPYVPVEPERQTTFITTAPLNLRPTPCTSGERIILVQPGRSVEVVDFRDDVWFQVNYNGRFGYMYARYLRKLPVPGEHAVAGSVELIQWSEARNIIPKNTPITIIDVRTQISYQIISFSHGSHADVFPVSADDTDILHQLFGRWSWTTRPILVVIGDRTFAASINGMPHGGGGNRGNNMNGHLCIHFQGSRTHNGSSNHENDHQRSVMEAFNVASNW